MTTKETKEWLNRAFKIEMRIRALEAQKQKWRELAYRATPSVVTTEIEYVEGKNKVKKNSVVPRTSGGNIRHSIVEDCVIKIMEIEQEINAEIDRLIDAKREIAAAIYKLDDETLRTILEYRFLCFMKFREIAEQMTYSERQVFYLYKRALKNIALICSSTV